jgi:hypothetical protein
VLPDAYSRPAGLLKHQIYALVAFPVAGDFLPPEICVGLRYSTVLGASVPVAAVEKYTNPLPSKDQIGADAQARFRLCVDTIT